jgi:uncharacterized protein (DUF433 family)
LSRFGISAKPVTGASSFGDAVSSWNPEGALALAHEVLRPSDVVHSGPEILGGLLRCASCLTKEESMALPEGITINPKVTLGKPVIRGTRIPVESILRKLGEGATDEELLDAYSNLESDDIRAALTYAAEALAHEDIM